MCENTRATQHEPSAEDTIDESLAEDKDLLARLVEHVKYLYEEENERRDVLNNTTKIYLGAFTFVVGIVLVKIAAVEKLPSMILNLYNNAVGGKYIALAASMFFLAAAGLFCTSFLLTVLVLRMWKRERLSDPERFVFRAMTMSDEARLLSAIVADYVVAGNRNHRINEQKARLLSKALFSFIYAFIVYVLTWVLLQTVYIF